jgi:hypothetical protein
VRWCVAVVVVALCWCAEARGEEPWACTASEAASLREEGERSSLWRGSDQAAQEEWARSRRLRERVGAAGLSGYRGLRREYLRRGVCRPALLMTEGLSLVRLFGLWVLVRRDVAAALEGLEGEVEAAPRLRTLGGFHARRVRGPFGEGEALSNHALGEALDLDAARNPFLSPEELALLEEISGVRLSRSASVDAGARWDNFSEVIRLFRERLPAWSQETAREMFALRGKARAGEAGAAEALASLERKRRLALRGRHLGALRRRDGFNLPRSLVVALERRGLVWSTDFASGADLMHFERRAR